MSQNKTTTKKDELRQSIKRQILQWEESANWTDEEKADELFSDLEENPEKYIDPDPDESYYTQASETYARIKEEHGLGGPSSTSHHGRSNISIRSDVKSRSADKKDELNERPGVKVTWDDVVERGIASLVADHEGDGEGDTPAPAREDFNIEDHEDYIREIAREEGRDAVGDLVVEGALK